MRAILIDAEAHKVEAVEIDGSQTLKELQRAVGGYIERAHTLPNGDDIFVNEEGLFNNPQHFFEIEGAHQPFAGNGIIVSADADGETVDAVSQVQEIEALVRFKDLFQVRLGLGLNPLG